MAGRQYQIWSLALVTGAQCICPVSSPEAEDVRVVLRPRNGRFCEAGVILSVGRHLRDHRYAERAIAHLALMTVRSSLVI
jgi:hypothetical protein